MHCSDKPVLLLICILQLVSFHVTAFSIPSLPSVVRGRSSFRQSSAATARNAIPLNSGTIEVSRNLNSTDFTYDISYKLYRPMSLSSRQAAPIVVLHGGPSVPSDYLLPLVQAVPYRSILFYDQLGCGESDEPTDINAYSIEDALDDLELILSKLGVRRYHLYGQSFGGILAFEFLKRRAQCQEKKNEYENEGCLSVILSSTPSNVRRVENEAQTLIEQLDSPDLFRETHQCRTSEMPESLSDAYSKAGTIWRGSSAIQEYVATKPSETAATMPSCLVIRGEHDFVPTECTQDWKELLNSRSVREKTLQGCSHHGLLENAALYGDTVDSFFREYD